MSRLRELISGTKRPDVVEALRARADRFRDLVERNNRVLELMADAEEKLSGDYLFDNQYLHSLDQELADTVAAVIQDLSEIAPGHHAALTGAFQNIRERVAGIIEMRPLAQVGPLCIDLARVGSEDASLLGEKMARLAELRSRLGTPIPPGFVITTAAFNHLVTATPGLERLIADADAPQADLAALSEGIRSHLAEIHLPREVARAIKRALKPLGRHAHFAVRSSAVDEDSELSFAGIHTSVMNVPRGDVVDAYRQVVASLFAERALAYRRSHGLSLQGAAMAVGCMLMVAPVASGVLYTFDPTDPASDNMLVSAAWGHGATVVEGTGAADRFLIGRHPPHRVVNAEIADKTHQLVPDAKDGLQRIAIASSRQSLPSVDESTLQKLADIALAVERHMRCPQDIEWAIDQDAAVWIMQARPLRLESSPSQRSQVSPDDMEGHPALLHARGSVACRGVGAGPVVMVSPATAPADTAPGSVLVTRYATPELSRLLPSANALISDSGSPAGHLAALAREYRIPAIVAARDASKLLDPGQEVTVDAEENAVYAGRIEALIRRALMEGDDYGDTREFRILRGMLKLVTPLTLLDPGSRGFKAERCATYHDVIRFAHEKAVTSLADLSAFDLRGARRHLRHVALDIPLGLSLIDLGGGVAEDAPPGDVGLDHITCAPLALLLGALTAPGGWDTQPAGMDLRTLLSSATRTGDFGATEARRNLAIVSSRHLHLNLFLGYHYNVIDCYLGDSEEDSFMLFRFVGGASDLARRVRRIDLLTEVLEHYGFTAERAGDLLLARLHAVPPSTMKRRLHMAGHLIGFTRQLDVQLHSEEIARAKVEEFLAAGDEAPPAGTGDADPVLEKQQQIR